MADDRRTSYRHTRFVSVAAAGLALGLLAALERDLFQSKIQAIAKGSQASWLTSLLVIVGLLMVLSSLGGLVLVGRYVVGPLDWAARHRRHRTQFTIADFLSLVFLLQLPMAAIRAMVDENSPLDAGVFYLFAWGACALMWGFSVKTLSQAGIERRLERGIFLTLVLPVAYFGALAFIITTNLFAASHGLDGRPLRTEILLLVDLGLLAAFLLAARFVRRIVAASQVAQSLRAGAPMASQQ